MIDRMDKKIFTIWISICVLGALIFSYIPNPYESNTSDPLAYQQCLADNNIEMNQSVLENYAANISESTKENDKKLTDEIGRYTKLADELCGDK